MKFKFNCVVASFIAATISLSVTAEDIELYVNHNVETDEKPRVLIVFDTSGSMGTYINYPNETRLTAAQSAMRQLVTENDSIDFGLMRFNNYSGGYVMAGIGTDHSTVIQKISSLPADGYTPITETLWEAYLYITGQKVAYAKYSNDRDFNVETGSYGNDYNSSYKSPFKQDLNAFMYAI